MLDKFRSPQRSDISEFYCTPSSPNVTKDMDEIWKEKPPIWVLIVRIAKNVDSSFANIYNTTLQSENGVGFIKIFGENWYKQLSFLSRKLGNIWLKNVVNINLQVFGIFPFFEHWTVKNKNIDYQLIVGNWQFNRNENKHFFPKLQRVNFI